MNVVVVGASGAIGAALAQCICDTHPSATLHTFSRTLPAGDCAANSTTASATASINAPRINAHTIDYACEQSIADAAELASRDAPLDWVIVANGLLHDDELRPEKSLRELSAEKFQRLFEANTIVPALIAKHFLPKLNRTRPARFAALSARVGSISDNRLGGWYGYRASKVALNMVIKTAAIETARRNPSAVVVTLHPGTVDSDLSKPFQGTVPEGQLFTPNYAAERLLTVLAGLIASDSGKCFAWDGQEILP
ncbi:MAG: SDR family NAD(P)-dependent oxidoreductase [Pseudomonadota bacterium]